MKLQERLLTFAQNLEAYFKKRSIKVPEINNPPKEQFTDVNKEFVDSVLLFSIYNHSLWFIHIL